MISALYILHRPDNSLPFLENDLLIQRRYHNDLPSHTLVLDLFCTITQKEKPHERSPFLLVHGISYMSVMGDYDILFLAVSRRNANAMLTVIFLHNLNKVLHHYLCLPHISKPDQLTGVSTEKGKSSHVTHLNRDVITDNLHVIHELFDECMDFGVIQTTDYNILKEYIKVEVNRPKLEATGDGIYSLSSSSDDEDDATSLQKWNRNRKSKKSKKKKKNAKDVLNIKSTHNHAISTQITGEDSRINSSILRSLSLSISWRPKGIFYAKNEIYIDIIEECFFVFDLETSSVRRNDIFGRCEVKSYLSGMPTCKIGFNEQHVSVIDNDDDDGSRMKRDLLEKDQNNDTQNGQIVNNSEKTDEEEGEDHEREGNMIAKSIDDDDEEEDDEHDENDHELEIAELEENSLDSSAKKRAKKRRKRHIPITNIQFHQCIQLGSIYNDNLVYFIPPDDKFTLLSYHVEQEKQKRKSPLITLNPIFKIIKHSKTLQVMCTLSTQFKKRLHAQNLVMKIPVNPKLFELDGKIPMKFKAQIGEVSYKIDSGELVWKIEDIPGGLTNKKMMAELKLVNVPNEDKISATIYNKFENNSSLTDTNSDDDTIGELDRFYGVSGALGPSKSSQVTTIVNDTPNDVLVSFSIPMLSYSGLKLTYLRVEEEQMKYTSFPWIRYKTESGIVGTKASYRFRLGVTSFSIV